MLERDVIQRQRDADAADERGVVLADEDHGARSSEGDDAATPAERGSSAPHGLSTEPPAQAAAHRPWPLGGPAAG